MKAAKYIIWCLVFCMGIGFLGLALYFKREPNDMVKLISLRNAMMLTVEGNLEVEGGFVSAPSTASELAKVLVSRFRSADSLSEEEEAELRSMGAPIVKIEYVLGDPTGPFQISVEPYDDEEIVMIRSWGRDLSEPIEEKEVKVSPY